MRNNKKNVILRLFVLIVFMLIQVVGFSISIQARIDEQQTVTMKNKKELTQENIVQNPEKQMKKIINEQFNPDRKIKKKINQSGDVGELNNNATPKFSFVKDVGGYQWYTQVDIEGWDTINLNNIGEDVYEQTTVLYPPLFDVKFDLGGYGKLDYVNLYYQPDELEDNQYEFYYTNLGYPTILSSSDITDENEKWLGYQSSGILVKPGTDITITSLMDRANVAEKYKKMNLDIYLRYFDKSGDLIISEKFPVKREDINTDTGFELMHTVPEDAVSLDILYNPYINADDIDGSHNGAYDDYLFGVEEASVYGEYPDNEREGDVDILYYSEDGEDLLEGSRCITGNIGEVVSPTIYDMDGYNYVGIDGVTPIRITDEDQEIKIIYRKASLDRLFNNIELIKYGETEDGENEELEDAEFILQFQITDWNPSDLETGDWYEIQNISLDPTDEDGEIILDKEDIRSIYKELEDLGLDEENVTFRFREIQSPQGFQNPPSYSPKEHEGYKYESSDLDSELEDFVVNFQLTAEDENESLSLELVNKMNTSHEDSLEIETEDIVVPLGTEIDIDKVEKHITSVELLENGKTTELDSYSIDDIVTSDSVSTNVVGSGETVVNIIGTKDGKEITGSASVPTEVTWGNDIWLGGWTDPANESTLALSLINDGNNTKIVGTYGDNTKHDRSIHSKFLDEDYYQIDYFPRDTSSPLNLTNDLKQKGTKSLTLKGKQTPADAIKCWGTQVVKEGDIIRVWMKEDNINWYQNGHRQTQLSEFPNRNLIYFEVAKDGFKPLYNNQVKGKMNIPINERTSKETLDGRYHDNPKELLDIPDQIEYKSIQYINGQFKTYPDTSTLGKDRKSNVIMIGQTKNSFGELNITFDVNPTFDVVEQQAQWLPSYSKWKNSNTTTIPKENAFVMMDSDDTHIVEWSDGVMMGDAVTNKTKTTVQFDTQNGPQWVMWDNVGYYDGENISVKMTVDPTYGSPSDEEIAKKNNTIGIRGTSFLKVSFLEKSQSAKVTYEFFNSEGNPIEINGYWTMRNIDDGKSIEILNSQIDNIYSIPNNGSNPILVSYEQTKEHIKFTGHGHFKSENGVIPTVPTNLKMEQLEMTMTFNNQKSFSYMLIIEPQNPFINNYLSYTSSSIARVGIPDPQSINQVMDSITKDNRDKLTNEFVQQIPYQSANNRNQEMTWTISNLKNTDIFSSGDWEVYDETGKKQTDLFEFDNVNKTIKPKDLKNSNLYNHYYKFVYSLPFNDKVQVDENQLITKDDGKYLPYSQDISLKVNNLSPVVATPTTDINFMATINYSYTDENGKPITMDGLAKTGTGLITQPYPVTKAPDIQGYTFNRSEPSDLTNKKILYTNNPVNFIYDKINKVQMTINYYQLDRQGKETTHRVIENLQTDNTVKALVKEVEVGDKISKFIPQSDFNSYLYKSSIVTNDVTNKIIEDDIVPIDNFTVTRYYQPLENVSVPKTISFGDKNAQRLKDEYSVKNDPSPINLTSGYSDVNWSLHASSDGLFSEGTNTRLLSDMYFRLNNEKMIINKEDTVLASQVNKHYYDLPLATEDNKEGLFLKIGNMGTKDSKYSGKVKFSMVTGP